MSTLIKVYKNNPTAGAKDGDPVTALSPVESGYIIVPLEGFTEGDWIKLAVRCVEGYITVFNGLYYARVSIVDSDGVTMWQLAPDNGGDPGTAGNWGAALDFTAEIGETNVIFWARARAEAGEGPVNDDTVSLKLEAVIGVA